MSHLLLPLLFVSGFALVVLAAAALAATRASLRRHPVELAPDAPPTLAEQRYPQFVTRRVASAGEQATGEHRIA